MVSTTRTGRLERWIDTLQERLQRAGMPTRLPVGSRPWLAVDVADREDEFVVTADVPGVDPEDLDVTVLDGALTLGVSREAMAETGDEHYVRRERRRWSVHRTIELPGPVHAEEVTASHADGVLTVRLPKADVEAVGRTIEVA